MWWYDVLDVVYGSILDYLFLSTNTRGSVANPNSLALLHVWCHYQCRSTL